VVVVCATPAVVSAELAAVVSPAHVPLSMEMLRVESFAAFTLRVRTTVAALPPTVNSAETAVSAASAVRILPATAEASSLSATGTAIVFGVPVIPAAVTTTEALPAVEIVPTTVAVSTWAVPAPA